MTKEIISETFAPKLLGFMFLFVVLASALTGVVLGMVNIAGKPDNISEIMIDISKNSTIVQFAILLMLIEAIGIVSLALLLFTILKTQSKILANLAFGLWIAEAVCVVLRGLTTFALLTVSQEYTGASEPHYLTLGNLFYLSSQFTMNMLMVFYCAGGLIFYYLFYKSKYVPTPLSVFGMVAVILAFIGEVLIIFGHDVSIILFLPILPFEVIIGVLLMVKGINYQSRTD